MERIERGGDPPAERERGELLRLIDKADRQLGRSEGWDLAKYAVVSLVDEILVLDAPWSDEAKEYWNLRKLETELFGTNDKAWKYFEGASEAATLSSKDALEVFYLGVVLGFQGLYRGPDARAEAENYGLPPDLRAWTRRTATQIPWHHSEKQTTSKNRDPEGAPPREGASMLGWSAIAGVVLGGIALGLLWKPLWSWWFGE